jgi:hypothetical protein
LAFCNSLCILWFMHLIKSKVLKPSTKY